MSGIIKSESLAASSSPPPIQTKPSSWYDRLYAEQRRALDWLADRLHDDNSGAALFSTQGTGKTFISLALLELLRPPTVLIVAPLTSLDVTWAPKLVSLPYLLCRTWEEFTERPTGKPKTRRSPPSLSTRSLLYEPPDPTTPIGKILLIHPQHLTKIIDRICRSKHNFDLVIYDESQAIKGRSTGFSRAAKRLAHRCRRRLALSGTPIDKSPIDVYAQMRLVVPTLLGTWAEFSSRYCHRAGFMDYEWRFNKWMLPDFLKEISPYIFRLSKDFLHLQPLTVIPHPTLLLGEQRRVYDQMENASIAFVKRYTIPDLSATGSVPVHRYHKFIADLKVTKKLRLEQITGGFLSDAEITLPVGRAKERKLAALLPELSPPIVVFCKFLAELEAIQRAADRSPHKRVALLTGATPARDRAPLLSLFQEGQIDLLACQLRTGGVSIDLTAAAEIVAYSYNHSYIDFEQFISRLHRAGQQRPVNVHLLYAVDTVDEEIITVIKNKKDNSFVVMDHLERAHG
jgi:SNF2 family DNA or RNA helicase